MGSRLYHDEDELISALESGEDPLSMTDEEIEAAKEERDRKNNERKGYFYEEQEQAVVDFIRSDSERERNLIFNKVLKPAFTQMIEAIIRRYHLFTPRRRLH